MYQHPFFWSAEGLQTPPKNLNDRSVSDRYTQAITIRLFSRNYNIGTQMLLKIGGILGSRNRYL